MSQVSFKEYLKPKNWPVMFGLGVLRLLSFLPLRILRKLGAFVGVLTMRLGKRRRHIAETNLKLCFPELNTLEQKKLLTEVFENTGMGLLELAWCWYAPITKLKASYTIEGSEHLTQATDNGSGVILLSFHFTSLEMGGILMGLHTENTVAMYRPHKNPIFENAMCRGRERALELVKRDNVRKAIKSLKQAKTLWYAADQNYGINQGVFVPFFGIQAATITATSWFAQKGRATVIPMTHKRTDQGLSITIHPPLKSFPSGDDKQDAHVIMAFLEEYLRQYPADYMWVHRRFKTRPQGEQGFY